MSLKRLPKIAIVGRANVGKSTLFNRFIRKPLSIVQNRPGITRDALKKVGYWQDWSFYVYDTGGLLDREEMDVLYPEVVKSIERAVEDADAVIFLTDGTSPPTPLDYEIANLLRKHGKKVFLAVNKADRKDFSSSEYYALGFENVYEISAEHRIGIGELMQDITSYLESLGFQPLPNYKRFKDKPRVSIIGRPNVGKSSLLNRFAGKEVVIVSDIPGTTRDAVDVELEDLILIDTAGVKRKYKDDVEYFAYVRTSRSIHYAHLLLVVLDATSKVTHVDKKLVGIAQKEYKALVVAINKIDLIRKRERSEIFRSIVNELEFAKWAPFIMVSARTGEGLENLRETIKTVYKEFNKQLRKDELYDALEEAFMKNAPPTKIYDIKQTGHKPPTFKFVVRKEFPSYYTKYLENFLRKRFGFLGTPIRFVFEVPEKFRKA